MKKVFFILAFAGMTMAANAQLVIGGQLGFGITNGNNHYSHYNSLPPVTNDDVDISGVVDVYDYLYNNNLNLEPNTTTFRFLPKVGYQLNKMQFGAQLGIVYSKTKSFLNLNNYVTYANQDYEHWYTVSQTTFMFVPYFRYNLTEFGKFTLFCEAQLAIAIAPNAKRHEYESAYKDVFDFEHKEVDEDDDSYSLKQTFIDFSITPGLNYKFNDKFSADLYIDLLGLGFNHTSTTEFVDNSVANVVNDTREVTATTNSFYLTANANAQTIADHFNLFRIGFNYHF
ncbi:MAG: hypothetical protein IJP80_01635 [Bacteroidales bacterium]|nr:hypothetical protein [Bacteroidales bacterium]